MKRLLALLALLIAGASQLFPPIHAQSISSYVVASSLSGADACVQIANGWAVLVAAGYTAGVVDARSFQGNQTCSENPFTNYPVGASGNNNFSGTLLLSGANFLLSDTMIIPGGARITGAGGRTMNNPPFTQAGAGFQAMNSFPAGHQIVQYGISRTNNPEGIWIDHVGINCMHPDSTFDGSSIGILNKYAQENSGGDHIDMVGCETGIDIESGGDDSGPFDSLHITITGGDATAHCVTIGLGFSFRGIHGFSCVGQSSGTQQNVGVYIDGENTMIESAHIEQFVTGIEVASAHFVQGLTLTNIGCQGGVTNVMTTCIDIASANNPMGYFINNVRVVNSGSGLPNVLVDHVNGGVTIPGASADPTLGFYGCNASGACGSSSPIANSARIPYWMSDWTGNTTASMSSSANTVIGRSFTLKAPSGPFSNIYAIVNTQDATGTDLYSLAIADSTGHAICHPTTGVPLTASSGQSVTFPCSEGTVSGLQPGNVYILLSTGSATTGKIMGTPGNAFLGGLNNTAIAGCTSASGVITFTTPCTISLSYPTVIGNMPVMMLH